MINKIDLDQKLIRTPNHVFDLISSFDSIYQLHIFLMILDQLQKYTIKEYNEHKAGQLVLFQQDVISINIRLDSISKPSEYRDVKTALLKMSRIICDFKYKDDKEERQWSGSLFSVNVPVKGSYSSQIKIILSKTVADFFILFNRNKKSSPIHFSKINTDIRNATNKKNTIKLYLFLATWRNRPFAKISLIDLCNYLGLGKSYLIPTNFKKHILEPANKILLMFNDVWFDFDKSEIDRNSVGETIITLKIKTKDTDELENKAIDRIPNMLRSHFNFKESDLNEITDIIDNTPTNRIVDKLSYLIQYQDTINNRVNYIKTVLINEFRK